MTESVMNVVSSAMNTAMGSASMASGGKDADVPFAGLLKSMVEQTGALDHKASETVTGVLNGSGVEIHDAMIATQKADMAFELALQVRNKAVGAYQQMMSMQF
jgi:flagellar hook-basal body complex protein FliE